LIAKTKRRSAEAYFDINMSSRSCLYKAPTPVKEIIAYLFTIVMSRASLDILREYPVFRMAPVHRVVWQTGDFGYELALFPYLRRK
jgi:hypothetical protein